MLAPDAPPPGYDCATPAAARIVAPLRSEHVPGDHDGVCAQQYNSGHCVECETAVWGGSEIITEVERRWRVVQHHLLHCDGGLDAHKRPSVNNLRLDLLKAAENDPSCVAAVQSAFAFLDKGSAHAPEDAGRTSAECVSYLTDPLRARGSPRAVGLTHCGLVAGYMLAVAGCVALRRDPWPAAQISALRLPRASRIHRHLQPEARLRCHCVKGARPGRLQSVFAQRGHASE